MNHHTYIITADDFGLSKCITDSILETFDKGALTSTTILANGTAVDYALQEYRKRRDRLSLSVHLNLTEGRPLSDPREISHLVDSSGMFCHSSASLLFTYFLGSRTKKAALRREVGLELQAQWERIRSEEAVVAADGHQHVHMIPFVFDIVTMLPDINYIRVPTEPFYYVRGNLKVYFGVHALARYVFLFLGHRNRAHAIASNIKTSDYVLGSFFSGLLSYDNVSVGLAEIQKYRAGIVEIISHPGLARIGELNAWANSHANTAWHFSPARTIEKELLMDGRFRLLLDHAIQSQAGNKVLNPWRLVRYVITGIVAFLTTLSLLYIFTELLLLWYVYSATIAYAISVAVSFVLQKYWTFENGASATTGIQISLFIFLNIVNICINGLGVYVLTELGLWYIISEFFVAAVIAAGSFFVMRSFIFK